MNFAASEILKEGPIARAIVVVVSVLIGYVAGRMASRAVQRTLGKTLDSHQVMIAKRLAFYGVMGLATLTGLNEAGINLSVLVGAAGVASVAIGFASQTTMSNLISGIFMLIERPFMVGDIIRVGGANGEVMSLGLISTILKTPENMMVRIPNETLMKSEITNTTRYPLRRVEIPIGVSYGADISHVRTLVTEALMACNHTRKELPVGLVFKSFGDNAINLALEFWVVKEVAVEAAITAAEAVKKALESAGVEMPFPQRTLSFAADQKLKVEVSNSAN
jgi:small-conductance mechanosensitive channel